jgi:hypothetical protein
MFAFQDDLSSSSSIDYVIDFLAYKLQRRRGLFVLFEELLRSHATKRRHAVNDYACHGIANKNSHDGSQQ